MTVVKDGEVTFPPPKISVSAAPAKKVEAAKKEEVAEEKPGKLKWVLAFAFAALFALIAHFTFRIPFSLYRVRISLRGWLLRCLECNPFSAYSVDVCNQRNFRYYCCRFNSANVWYKCTDRCSFIYSNYYSFY